MGVPEYLLGTPEKNKTATTRGIVSVTRSPNETEGKLFSGGAFQLDVGFCGTLATKIFNAIAGSRQGKFFKIIKN